MAKTVNVNRVFEAVARIVTQREEGAKVTLVEVKRVENRETAAVGEGGGRIERRVRHDKAGFTGGGYWCRVNG